jgi:cob(I)alamin adenosyltransferase
VPDHPDHQTDGTGDDADVGSAGASADGGGAVDDDLAGAGEPVAEPPLDDPRPDGLRNAESLVVVNTGDGKGKSSAAFGIVMRSVARDWPVAVVQFLKSGSWQVGEEKIGRRLGVDWWALGEGFTWDSDDLTEDQAVAREAWRHAAELLATGSHRLVVLDEITYPMNWGWIDTAEVVAAIAARSPKVNVVATGRDAPAALLGVADTATEMRVIKHAYDNGIVAKKGIDY